MMALVTTNTEIKPMKTQLFQHQIEDIQFLLSRRFAGCFNDMGTGKTLTAIGAVNEVIRIQPGVRTVIVAPPIATKMWSDVATEELGVEVQLLPTGKTKIADDTSIIVVTYDIASKRSAELRDWHQGGIVICDESHALKNVKAKRTVAILGKGGLVCGARHAIMLTGTPMTRWSDDLYPFLCRADIKGLERRCGGTSKFRFDLRYTIQQARQFGRGKPVQMVVGNRNTDELNEWVYGEKLAIRRTIKEVHDAMPPITFNTYTVSMRRSKELREMLEQIEQMAPAQIEQSLKSKEPALASIRREIGLAKIEAAADEIIERHENGLGPILVGAWHSDVIDLLVDTLGAKGLKTWKLDGRTAQQTKTKIAEAFNNGEIDVLVGQIAAMGVSLNLQKGGNRIIVIEPDWSPSVMDQFYARLWRYGQEKHVHVDTLLGDNKLEAALMRISGTKRREHERFNRGAA